MILNLDNLPYVLAIKIIRWCVEHDIDKSKCIKMIEFLSISNQDKTDISWEIEIPEKYITFFVLKFKEFQSI